MAHIAHEFHIPPSAVLAESPRMQATMLRYLRWRVVEQQKAVAEAKRRTR